MFSKQTYIDRRNGLKALVGNGIILLPGNEESSMNYKDNLYHFRQDSSFLYYTGLDKPALFFLMDIDNNKETIFGDEATIDDIVWTGATQTIHTQAEQSGITTVLPVSTLVSALQQYTNEKRKVHYLPPYRADTAVKISEWLNIPYNTLNDKASIPLIKAIVKQRSVKSAEEIAEMEKAINVTADMQLKAMQLSREGVPEYQVAGHLEGIAKSAGGNLSFPIILTTNGQYLHNHAGSNILKNGQLLLCDCGAELQSHYAGDLTRTSPVGGRFTSLQKQVYNIVLNAQEAALAALAPGKKFIDIHLLACEKLTAGLQQLGLMKGDIKEAVAAGAHTLFFQCGLGHMMGLDVHDMENLGEQYVGYTDDLKKSTAFGLKSLRLARALEEGFVVTIEPGLYFIPELMDMWSAENKHSQFINYGALDAFRNFGGIRIEDDALITATGSRVLGKPLAKTSQEIEALCG
ncbi:Xaa-Pro aminopeptidase [Terrimonas sp.]|uniref:aminopeptidase P family protein n=1 Tax=Terrimonas sp. TaxID=1914338 RepID=UPI000D5081EF|nr:aminopeptidase P family protein [Terrimonas sp.]PVD51334.1 Xaa-Pro aminopeptidase [Terrimonas sp.]